MKKYSKAIAAIMLMMMMFAVGCKKTEQNKVEVKTSQVTDITSTTATASGMIVSVGNSTIIECGVCWREGDYTDPTVTNYHMSAGNGALGSFTCKITGLLPNTHYQLRAYVLDDDGVTYGYSVGFKTLADNGNGGGNGSGNGTYNGHAYVDLGLPSGTLWATCNVGATTPEGYGDYFAWGETQPKAIYNWNTYKYCNGSSDQLTKYCNNSDYGYNGFTDNLTALQPSDDAATVNWGSGWRMPTYDQWSELYDNTTNTWTTQNGVNGWLFTSNNSNSLFLPAAGYRGYDELIYVGSDCIYWVNKLGDIVGPSYAWHFHFDSDGCHVGYSQRRNGPSVRAVRSARQN